MAACSAVRKVALQMALLTSNARLRGQACLALLLLAHLLDVQVSADHAEHVQVLSLVLMNTLDLNIVQGIGGHLGPRDFLQALHTNSSQCVVLSYGDNKHMLMLSHMHLLTHDNLQ